VNLDLHSSWLLQPFYPGLTWKKEVQDKSVFLTFDDGPQPGATDFVLETLEHYGFDATFFCIGENVIKHNELFEHITACNPNHRIGNHTHNHPSGFSTSVQDYIENTQKAENQINSKLFRPPYGRITRRQIKAIQHLDFEIIMWSILSCDYMSSINTDHALKRMKQLTKPGSIIVFHDSLKALENLKKLLPAYCEFLAKNGYTSCSL